MLELQVENLIQALETLPEEPDGSFSIWEPWVCFQQLSVPPSTAGLAE